MQPNVTPLHPIDDCYRGVRYLAQLYHNVLSRRALTSMEGISVATSVIAVVDLSAKVTSLCFQYSTAVANARADIKRLYEQAKSLDMTLQYARRLLEESSNQPLPASRQLVDQLQACEGELERLRTKLEPSTARKTMRRIGYRALKWPFSSKDTEAIMTALERYQHTIALGLQIDQTRKSQVAIEFAHEVRSTSPDTNVFWVHGGTKARFEESYRYLADILALPRRHDPKVNTLALVRDWLQREDVAPWLMILDNADDLDTFFDNTGPTPMASYLPKSSHGKILVASRNVGAAEKLTGGHNAIMRIPTMDSTQALQLFRKKLNRSLDEDKAADLVHALDFIPLAVNQAAAFINRRTPRVSIRSYLDSFRESEKMKNSLLNFDAGDLRRHENVSNSVVVTWQAVLHEQPLDEPDILKNQGRWEEGEKLEVQVMEIRRTKLGADHPDTLMIMGNLASTYSGQGRWEEAEKLEVQVMETRRTKLGADHPDTLMIMGNLASTYNDQGRWEEAEKLGVQVMEISKTKFGTDHPDTLISMGNLASTYRNQGRWEEAEKLETQVTETFKAKLGVDHPDTLKSIANVASTYSDQGRWEKAEKLGVQVMEISKTKFGVDHPDTLKSIGNLAWTYKSQGRW
ncbi:hypothetical protein DL771_003260 [Monosporascus sp. 5C6A]|nr:hypothetical protein DL771_003260 [Monosporascus sp. 5C6A]